MTGIFERPMALLLILAILPAILFFFVRFRKLKASLVPLVSGPDSAVFPLSRTLRSRSVLFSLAWAFLACAAASPRWGTELVSARQEGSSVFFVLDVSRSMTVADVAPSRLAFASGYASMLLDRLGGTRCGAVLVKGDAVLSIPLTADHRSLKDLFASLSPSMLSSPGSAPARGVDVALSSFPQNGAASRTIILITDGDETSSSLRDAALRVRASGTRLVIVGVGTAVGKEMNAFPSGDETRLVTTVLRDDILRAAARSAGHGSVYVNGVETGSAQRVVAAAVGGKIGEQKIVYSSRPVYRYAVFLLAAFVAFCAGCVSGGVSWRRS